MSHTQRGSLSLPKHLACPGCSWAASRSLPLLLMHRERSPGRAQPVPSCHVVYRAAHSQGAQETLTDVTQATCRPSHQPHPVMGRWAGSFQVGRMLTRSLEGSGRAAQVGSPARTKISPSQVWRLSLQFAGTGTWLLCPDEIPATSTEKDVSGGGDLVGAQPPAASPQGALGASNHLGAPLRQDSNGVRAALRPGDPGTRAPWKG